MQYLGINIDLSRDSLFDTLGIKRLQESYMMENETSPQHRFAYVSKANYSIRKNSAFLEVVYRLPQPTSKHKTFLPSSFSSA